MLWHPLFDKFRPVLTEKFEDGSGGILPVRLHMSSLIIDIKLLKSGIRQKALFGCQLRHTGYRLKVYGHDMEALIAELIILSILAPGRIRLKI